MADGDRNDATGGSRGEDPRLAQTREIVLTGAVALLVEEGLRKITVARLHKRTGVARTTIYRHWPTRTALLLATLDRITVPAQAIEATDDFASDLRALLVQLKLRMEARPVREMVSATLAMSMEEPDHAEVARRFLEGMLAPIRARIEHEASRSGLEPNRLQRLHDRVVGPILFRHVMMLDALDAAQIEEVVEHAVASLRLA